MFRKVLTVSIIAAALGGACLASSDQAEARWSRGGAFAAGAAAGLIGGALLAAPAYAYSEPVYYEPACWWKKKRVYDANGNVYVRRVQICR